jgi:hypothetical protein
MPPAMGQRSVRHDGKDQAMLPSGNLALGVRWALMGSGCRRNASNANEKLASTEQRLFRCRKLSAVAAVTEQMSVHVKRHHDRGVA